MIVVILWFTQWIECTLIAHWNRINFKTTGRSGKLNKSIIWKKKGDKRKEKAPWDDGMSPTEHGNKPLCIWFIIVSLIRKKKYNNVERMCVSIVVPIFGIWFNEQSAYCFIHVSDGRTLFLFYSLLILYYYFMFPNETSLSFAFQFCNAGSMNRQLFELFILCRINRFKQLVVSVFFFFFFRSSDWIQHGLRHLSTHTQIMCKRQEK